MKGFFLCAALLFSTVSSAQLEQLWKTDFQITSDTFNTFGYKTDSAGNFYLYGWQHNRVFLQKHDPNGNIEWTINEDSIIDSLTVNGYRYPVRNTRITDVAFDGNLDIYVTGISSHGDLINPNYEAYFFISKLKNDGTLLWKQNSSTRSDSFSVTMWNPDVNILFVSDYLFLSYKHLNIPIFCSGRYNYNFGLTKFDTSGAISWNRVLTGDSSYCTRDIVSSLYVRDTLIAFSGFSTTPSASQSKIVTTNFDKNGTFVQRVEENEFISDPYNDQAYKLYLTDAYTIHGQAKGATTYITAESADSVEQSKRNLLIIKYDNNLNRIWRYDLQKDTAVNIEVKKSLMDDSCNVLVSAIWKENGEDKALFLKLDSTGQEKFRDTFSDKVETNGCFINPKGEYVLFTSAHIGSSYNTSLRKYSSSGEIVWDSTLTIPGKIIHGWVDSTYLYLVLLDNKTLSYLKFKDTNLSVGIPPASYGQVTVYPNPVSEVLCINSLQDSESYTYQIFSLTGLLLTSGKVKSKEIQLSGLAPGTYILILTDQSNHFSATKFIKQ